jgi:hypothetical protein
MKIIKTLKEALSFCQSFIDTKETKENDLDQISSLTSSFVPSDDKGPWQMSSDALKTTLKYIFEKLHHSCYLLCSNGKTSTLVKLESTTTAPFFKKVLEEELNRLNENTTLTEKQKGNIRKFVQSRNGTVANNLRILQCIVKKTKEEATSSNEYERFIEGIELPPGVYVMNLTDANLLKKDGSEPFPIYRKGSVHLLETSFKNADFLPIFSLSGNRQFYDVPIPNYDDVTYILGEAKYNIQDFTTSWSDKTILKAVFRGGPSGCGTTIETNQRLRLTTLSSTDLDVGIVGEKGTIDSNSIRFDPVEGLSMLNTGIRSVSRLDYVAQSKYKYIIHIDGNVHAYRFLTLLATGSVVLRVKSDYTSWLDSVVEPGKHYIEIKSDLSDLLEKIEWCKVHDEECSQIAETARKFASLALTADYVRGAFQKIVLHLQKQMTLSSPVVSSAKQFPSDNIDKVERIKIKKIKPKVAAESNKTIKSVNISMVDSSENDFYVKGDNEKKCKKGYSQDKRDKTKCNKTKKNAKVSLTSPKIPSPKVSSISPKIPSPKVSSISPKILSPKVSSISPKIPPLTKEESESYIKGENEKKCKKGYVQDKRDKTKCNKTQKNNMAKVLPIHLQPLNPYKQVINKPAASLKQTSNNNANNSKMVAPLASDTHESSKIRRKCNTLKLKIRDELMKNV